MDKDVAALFQTRPELAAVIFGFVFFIFSLIGMYIPFVNIIIVIAQAPGFVIMALIPKLQNFVLNSAIFWALLVYLFVGLPMRLKGLTKKTK